MSTEPSPNSVSPVTPAPEVVEDSQSAARPNAGPLAKFTRGASEGTPGDATRPSGEPSRQSLGEVRSQAEPGNEKQAEPGNQTQGKRPPRGKGNRPPRPRSDAPQNKQQAENAEVDRGLEVEQRARRESGPKARVPVPNRRERPEDLEAEIAAALGDLSLDDIAAAPAKNAGERLENESRHRAQVAELHGDDVFFTLGGKEQGIASLRSFTSASGEPVPPQVGDMVDVVVTGYNSEDNLYDLAIPGAAIVAGKWSDVAEGSLVEARVTGANTGGLECQVSGTRAFIPASQVALYRIENFGDYVGQKLVCVVTESNERRGNLVLSRRAVLEREKEESKKALLAELEPGQMREGVVRKIQDFGAFVDLGGIDGLVHVSQMSWERIKHPSELLAEGQKVRVRIEKIDHETGKIGLSLKNPEEHPWTGIEQRFPVGSTIRGLVSRIAQFGAFVKLAPGVEGLIHISELAHHKVFRVENVVKEGEEVECKVLSVDADAQRIGLSLKATIAKAVKENDKPKDQPEAEEPPRELAVPKRRGPLKGGAGKSSGGEQFGLKW
jgi:predicted RNA-binding protein with RPS1 domain